MIRMKNCFGFTLVEAVVTSVIVVIAGLAFITVFIMFSRQQREDFAMTAMQMQYEALRQQIGDDARASAWVHSAVGRPVLPQLEVNNVINNNAFTIYMINNNGSKRRKYTINSTAIMVDDKVFVTGHGPIKLKAGGSIILNKLRDQVLFNNIELTTTVNGTTYNLTPRSEAFLCRNWKY